MDARTEKNNPGWLNPNVLTDFIDDLRDAGYKIGISQYIAAQDLILALTAQGETLNRPERLKTLLGPIFCSSPAEQEDFQERFDHWIEFVSQIDGATETTDVKAQTLSEELGKIRWRFRQLILTLIAIILTGIFLPILWESIKDDSSQLTQPNTTQPNTTQPNTTQPNITQPNTTQPNPDFPLDWQISLFCFLLTLCIAFLVWRLWWLRRAHLFLQRRGTMEQPELHKISIGDFEQNLFPTIMFIHAAQSLRNRIRIPSNELDVDTTIDATLRQGGWLTPVYSTLQVLPEYLFLINRASYRDHQAKFIEEMVARLRHNGVFITSYFFNDDPRICFPIDSTSSPQKLHQITAKYTQHRLVIVSDTEKLFSTQTGELEPWVSQLTTRGSRAILTPKPVENWGYQELELARQFIVLPATPNGVRVLSQVLHQGTATYVLSEKDQISLPEPLRVRPHYWIERNPPKPEQSNTMLNSLQEYLGKDGFYWLSACAVFPELHWNITIYLGNVLKTAEGHCLLEVCPLTNLARLPWFRYGNIPDWLRSFLIATLTYEQKHTIRTALQDLLITAVQGSVGRLQLEVAQKHHSFLPKLANSILYLLSRRVTEGSPLRDYLFLSFMTGQPKLAIEVSDTFSRLLQNQKRLHWWNPNKKWRRVALVCIFAIPILTIAGFYIWQYYYNQAIARTYNNRAIVLRNLGDNKGALDDFNQALRLNPKDANAYYGRGNVRSDLGDKKGALDDYNQALRLNPKDANAYYNRAIVRSNLGDNKGALEDYNQALRLDPNYANAYYNRAIVRSNLGDNKGALEDYNQALRLNPKDANAYYNRAIVLRNLGDNKGALEDYNQALRLNPNFNSPDSDVFYQGRKIIDYGSFLAFMNREPDGWKQIDYICNQFAQRGLLNCDPRGNDRNVIAAVIWNNLRDQGPVALKQQRGGFTVDLKTGQLTFIR